MYGQIPDLHLKYLVMLIYGDIYLNYRSSSRLINKKSYFPWKREQLLDIISNFTDCIIISPRFISYINISFN